MMIYRVNQELTKLGPPKIAQRFLGKGAQMQKVEWMQILHTRNLKHLMTRGAEKRIRTSDLLFTKQLLYH